MYRPRIIPCLLLHNGGLVKTVKFRNPAYIGDPINAVKIFNDKGVDELIFIDITASAENRSPDLDMIKRIASESFMPVCYGGGIKTVAMMKKIFNIGIEKVSIGSSAVENAEFVREAAEAFGSQSIVVCIDVKKNLLGSHQVVTHNAKRNSGLHPIVHAEEMEKMGAGEIMINSVDRDGTMTGYDIDIVRRISDAVMIPVIACGGAGNVRDFVNVLENGHATAVSAGSIFVFYGRQRAVLINYPSEEDLEKHFN